MSWVLLLFVVHYESVTLTKIGGFANESDCNGVGQAWVLQANRRQEQSDVTFFRCKPANN